MKSRQTAQQTIGFQCGTYLDRAELAASCQSLISPLVMPRGLEQTPDAGMVKKKLIYYSKLEGDEMIQLILFFKLILSSLSLRENK